MRSSLKRQLRLLIALVGVTVIAAAFTPLAHAGTIFDDEFSGSSLDTTKWTAIDNWGPACCGEVDWNHAANVSVSGGAATITTYNTTDGGVTYSSGRIQTMNKFQFMYGTVEFSARMAPGDGLWTALWLMPATESWPYEIDVNEMNPGGGNSPDSMNATLHYPTSDSTGGNSYDPSSYNAGVDLTAGYHTYKLEWEPTYLKWYLDGTLVKTETSHIPNVPMYLIINNQVHAGPGNTSWPTTTQVDYVRVTQDTADDRTTSFDDMSDYSKMYAHSSNLALYTANASSFRTLGQPSSEGDRVGLSSSAGSGEYIEYSGGAAPLSGFYLDVYSDPNLAYNAPTFSVSDDGTTWTSVSTTALQDGVGTSWRHTSYNVATLPGDGTAQYLKITYPSLGANYSATQIAKLITTTGGVSSGGGLTRYDDDAASYTGSGWAQWPDASDYGGNQHYTTGSGDYATFSFTGTSVDFAYTTDSNRGKADIYIDGSYVQTVDFYSASAEYQQTLFSTTSLSSGSHTLKIVNNGTKDAASSNYFIGIDFLDAGSVSLVRYDDGSGSYTGAGWAQWSDASCYGGNQHYTTGSGDYVTFSFTGTTVDFGYTTDSDRGRADIYIDGTYVQTVDFYSATTHYQQTLFSTTSLGSGSHTLKIVNNGTKDAASSNYFIGVDYFDAA